jgi:ABC-type nickel/cobalt efflux system permease component RcnA
MKRLATMVIAVLVFLLGAPKQTAAHPMGNFSINHYARIRVGAEKTAVQYILDFAEIPTYQLGGLHTDEWVANLSLRIGGENQPLSLEHVDSQKLPGAGGLPTLRVVFDLASRGIAFNERIDFADTNFPDRLGWKEIVVESDGTVAFPDGNPFTKDLSNALTSYPSDLLSSPPNIDHLSIRVSSGFENASTNPKSEIRIPNSQSGSSAWGTLQKGDRLSQILVQQDLPLNLVLLGCLIAFCLGSFHALSPGHGKTIVAAYLVGNRGTAKHAVFLGAVVTFTHTIGVFLLGLLTLFASRYIVPETLYPWMGFLSGMMVLVIGLNLFRQRFAGLHHHDHTGNHDHGHSHAVPEKITASNLLALGVSGGIVPCPSALVVLLSAIALHRIEAGLLFIVAFSAGLASVLVGIGILVVRAGGWLSRFSAADTIARNMPVVSAAVISALGLGIAAESLAGAGVLNLTSIAFRGDLLVVLGLGLFLGLKHATDADHIVAVTTFVSGQQSILRSCWIGAFWGIGHTLSLALAGLIVIALNVSIPDWVAERLEFLVAVMLVGLGVRVLVKTWCGTLEGHTHAHSHEHLSRPLLVGMVHGAAGSAALMLLVLSTIRSPLEAFLYIVIFGFGSVLGMLAISLLLALPLQWASRHVGSSFRPIQMAAGFFSCVFGLYLGATIWMSLS